MSTPRAEEIGLRVGLEVHQQLSTGRKLFCSCPVVKTEEFPFTVKRKLRPSQSELGHIDPAAVFEFLKGKFNIYMWNKESSCLVELDEEPPHNPDMEAVEAAILIALALNSEVVDEIHVMRKIVIDGSNTSGFQRTAIIALGGYLEFSGRRIGVQAVTLEEDAARVLGEDEKARYFALDRLGIPLVEISLDPVTASPKEIEEIALALGRTLRSTGKVARGLGTIRQDLNISVSGGAVVEVKGVQKLELISKVVEYEMKRQSGLNIIAAKLREKGIKEIEVKYKEVQPELFSFLPDILKKDVDGKHLVGCIVAKKIAGFIGYEPYSGIRLGKELAEVARANSIGGIIHSDEFQKLGLDINSERKLRVALEADEDDALILFVCERERSEKITNALIERLKYSIVGVPPETRGPTAEGETRYMRPRPGAERMYPETDIPEIVITREIIDSISRKVPVPWAETVKTVSSKYNIKEDTALRLFDEGKIELFSEIVESTGLPGPYVASVIVDTVAWALREGAEESRITDSLLRETLSMLSASRITKEAVPEILLKVGKGEASSPEQAADLLGIRPMPEEEVEKVVERIVRERINLITERGDKAFSALMGEVMKETRGRAKGENVALILKKKIEEISRG